MILLLYCFSLLPLDETEYEYSGSEEEEEEASEQEGEPRSVHMITTHMRQYSGQAVVDALFAPALRPLYSVSANKLNMITSPNTRS